MYCRKIKVLKGLGATYAMEVGLTAAGFEPCFLPFSRGYTVTTSQWRSQSLQRKIPPLPLAEIPLRKKATSTICNLHRYW